MSEGKRREKIKRLSTRWARRTVSAGKVAASIGGTAVRQAVLRVQSRGRGLSIRADLRRRGADRIRRLQFVAALRALPATRAVADVNAELANDRLAGDIGLQLLDDLGFDERPVAVGAVVG